MLRILHDTKIDFIKSWRLAVVLTAGFIAAGLIALVIHGGLNRSIEFTGGTLMQLEFAQPPNVADIRSTVDAAGFTGSEIQQFGGAREFTVRAASHATASTSQVENTATQIKAALERKFGAGNVRVVREEIVGPRVGDELSRNAMIAILISLGITLVYLAIRFEWRFGVAAVIATGHDLLSRDADVGRAELALQRRLDLRGRALHRRAGRRRMARGPHGELSRRAELLDLRARVARGVDRRADVADVGRLGELELHQRAAGELDALVESSVQDERDQAGGDEGGGEADCQAPALDEIDLRVVQDAQHGSL